LTFGQPTFFFKSVIRAATLPSYFNHLNQGGAMRKKTFIPASVPRNKVVRALIRLTRMGAGLHKSKKRVAAHDQTDLAQRVREVGEW
jgi:hypothetical protein